VADADLQLGLEAVTARHAGSTLGFDELKLFLAARQVAKFMWPEQLEIVTDMPMTPTRKVIKSELVRRLLEQASGRTAA